MQNGAAARFGNSSIIGLGALAVSIIAVAALASGSAMIANQQPVNSTAATDNGLDRNIHVGMSPTRAVAVWESSFNSGGIGTDYDIFRATSSDAGTAWNETFVHNTNAAADGINNDTVPNVATNGTGIWLTVWDGRDNFLGAGNEADIFILRSLDDAATWQPMDIVNTNAATDTGHDSEPKVLFDGGSRWIVIWRSLDTLNSQGGSIGTDTDILMARSSDDGATWTNPQPVNNAASDATATDNDVALATDRNGNMIACWQSNNTLGGTIGGDQDILFARSTDHGATWSLPAALNSNAVGPSANDEEPVIATDGNGRWIAAWHSLHTLGGTIGADADVLYSISDDHGATWSAASPIHGFAFTDGVNDHDRSPSIATDGEGRWAVVWHSTHNLGASIGADADILMVTSEDNGATWSLPRVVNSNAGSDTGVDDNTTIATDSAGNWIVAWTSTDNMGGTIGNDNDVLSTRFAWPDCNRNGIADASEVDCNENGVPDDCDIAVGSSLDENSNGVPDECEKVEPVCVADIAPSPDGDGAVGVPDLLAVINAWGPCGDPRDCAADVAPSPEGDDVVGVPDLLAIINAWGPCE